MTAIKTTNIVEGNLAQEPKYFPKGQYVARIVFRIMHTDRKLNPQTNQWEDGRTTRRGRELLRRYSRTVRADHPTTAGRVRQRHGSGRMGRTVRPSQHVDRPRRHPQATPVINGTRIIPNQLVNQRRANRQQSNSTSLPQYTNAVPEQDPWAGQQAQA